MDTNCQQGHTATRLAHNLHYFRVFDVFSPILWPKSRSYVLGPNRIEGKTSVHTKRLGKITLPNSRSTHLWFHKINNWITKNIKNYMEEEPENQKK